MPRNKTFILGILIVFLLCLVPPMAQAAPVDQQFPPGQIIVETVMGYAVRTPSVEYPWVVVYIGDGAYSGYYLGNLFGFVTMTTRMMTLAQRGCLSTYVIGGVPYLRLSTC